MDLPFVREQLIFVVDAAVKIGFNFDEVRVKVDHLNKKIVLQVPELKMLSNEILYDSARVLDERTGIFARRHMEGVMSAMDQLRKEAEANAHNWGAFDRARASTKDRLTVLVGKFFDLRQYELRIIFADDSNELAKTKVNSSNICA